VESSLGGFFKTAERQDGTKFESVILVDIEDLYAVFIALVSFF
jgi:hypothetical protein